MLIQVVWLPLAALFAPVLAVSKPIRGRGLQNNCNQDNLLRSFTNSKTSSAASSYCSSYIRSTDSASATATTTVFTYRSTQSSFSIASTYSPSRVSSACSCILTAAPSPTTIYTITKTLPATPTCTPPVIVQNGNFENGQNISPWVVNDYPGDAQHETYGVVSPGYGGSQYAYEASDDLPLGAYPAFDLRLNQTLKLCKDQRYNISARYYISDEPDGYNGAIYLQIVTPRPGKREGDTQVVASATTGDVYGNGTAVPPGAWKTLEGSFLANLDEVTLVVDFSSHSYSNRQFGLDDVVVFPA